MSDVKWEIPAREKPRPEFEERLIEQELAEAYEPRQFPGEPKRPRKVPL